MDIDVEQEITSVAKRPRVSLACECCRRRKIRCDAAKPTCANCVKAGFDCVYVPTKRHLQNANAKERHLSTKSSNRGSDSTKYERRLERVEMLLSKLLENGTSAVATKSVGLVSPGVEPATSSSSTSSDTRPLVPASDISSLSDNDDRDSTNCLQPRSDNEFSDHGGDNGEPSTDMKNDLLHDRPPIAFLHKHSACESAPSKKSTFGVGADPTDDDVILYSHGLCGSMVNPANLKLWARICHEPKLAEKMASIHHQVWSQQILYIQRLSSLNSDSLILDGPLVELCLDKYIHSNTPFLRSLISSEELQSIKSRNSWVAAVRSGSPNAMIYTSIVIYICSMMLSSGDTGQFSRELIHSQIEVAALVGLRSMNLIPLAPPTFSLFRAVVLFAVVSSVNSTFSQVQHILAVAYRVALIIGLNRAEFYHNLSPRESHRRRFAWWICYCSDLSLSLIMSHSPTFYEDEISTPLPEPFGTESEQWGIEFLMLAVQLHRIYSHFYSDIYSVKGRLRSTDDIVQSIFNLDKDLKEWNEQYLAKEKPPDNVDGDFMLIHIWNMLSCQYYMLTLQIYSLVGFTRLKDAVNSKGPTSHSLRNPVDTISNAAEKCIELGSSSTMLCNNLALYVTISTAIVSLFMKIFLYPTHVRNEVDRRLIMTVTYSFQPLGYFPVDFDQGLRRFWLVLTDILKRDMDSSEHEQLAQTPSSVNAVAKNPVGTPLPANKIGQVYIASPGVASPSLYEQSMNNSMNSKPVAKTNVEQPVPGANCYEGNLDSGAIPQAIPNEPMVAREILMSQSEQSQQPMWNQNGVANDDLFASDSIIQSELFPELNAAESIGLDRCIIS